RKLAQHGKSRAASTNGNSATHQRVDRVLRGRVLPELDVVGLVAAGNEQSFRLEYDLRHRGMVRGVAVRYDQRGDGILRAQIADVGIVSVGSGGANHQKITAAGFLAHPT